MLRRAIDAGRERAHLVRVIDTNALPTVHACDPAVLHGDAIATRRRIHQRRTLRLVLRVVAEYRMVVVRGT